MQKLKLFLKKKLQKKYLNKKIFNLFAKFSQPLTTDDKVFNLSIKLPLQYRENKVYQLFVYQRVRKFYKINMYSSA